MVSPMEAPNPSYLETQALVDNREGYTESAEPLLEERPIRSSISTSSCDGNLEAQVRPDLSPIQLPKGSLTYLNGVALVVSLQIGSGIFFVPSEVSKHIPSAGAGVLIWLFAGLMVWTGAASFIELGRAIPNNGGIQEYLRCCYGEFYGFMFSWIWVSIYKPASIAVIATIFGKHVNTAILPESMDSIWVDKVIAVTGLTLLTLINCLGTNTGALAANGFLMLKLGALFSIVVIGLWIGLGGKGDGVGQGTEPGWFSSGNSPSSAITSFAEQQEQNNWERFGYYVTALFAALFCYAGWETVSQVVVPVIFIPEAYQLLVL